MVVIYVCHTLLVSVNEILGLRTRSAGALAEAGPFQKKKKFWLFSFTQSGLNCSSSHVVCPNGHTKIVMFDELSCWKQWAHSKFSKFPDQLEWVGFRLTSSHSPTLTSSTKLARSSLRSTMYSTVYWRAAIDLCYIIPSLYCLLVCPTRSAMHVTT